MFRWEPFVEGSMARGKSPFVEIGDDRRRPILHPARLSAIAEQLLAGKTLLVNTDGKTGIPRQSLAKRGYQVHTRKDADGMVVWADKIE
jgi:hypothetical protein